MADGENKEARQVVAAVSDIAKQALGNPVLSGLIALALNQAAYKGGLYHPRRLSNGQWAIGSWNTPGIDWSSGFPKITSPQLTVRGGTEMEAENIAANNATLISGMLMTATLLYAQKAPQIQPIIGVKT